MKKLAGYFIRYILCFMVLIYAFSFSPRDVSASTATTLAELRAELKALQAKKAQNEAQQEKSESEKAAANNSIAQANAQIQESETKIAEAKQLIEDTEEQIAELEEQTEQVLEFYQIMSGENAYLEFISDSSSMTELIMRIDAVEQILDYNKEKLSELEELIESNEQAQVDLIAYEAELEDNISAYEAKIDEIDSSLLELEDISYDIDDEIAVVQQSITMYENMGCGENESFTSCASYSTNTTWLKPVTKGYITSLFGYRTVSGQSSYHSGIDIGVSEGTTVYSATNGKVVYIVNKSTCGGNQVYIESNVNGTTYTMLYAHLLSISVSVGQTVTNQTVIGYSGGKSTATKYGGYDRCTTGAHLHYSVSKSNWTSLSHFTANLINPPGYPGKGVWFYSRTQWFD